jgi:hypothetical protein
VCKGERMEKAIETVGNTKHEGSVSGTVRRWTVRTNMASGLSLQAFGPILKAAWSLKGVKRLSEKPLPGVRWLASHDGGPDVVCVFLILATRYFTLFTLPRWICSGFRKIILPSVIVLQW